MPREAFLQHFTFFSTYTGSTSLYKLTAAAHSFSDVIDGSIITMLFTTSVLLPQITDVSTH